MCLECLGFVENVNVRVIKYRNLKFKNFTPKVHNVYPWIYVILNPTTKERVTATALTHNVKGLMDVLATVSKKKWEILTSYNWTLLLFMN